MKTPVQRTRWGGEGLDSKIPTTLKTRRENNVLLFASRWAARAG